MDIWATLSGTAARWPGRFAVRDGDLRFAYRELEQRALALARFLLAQGLRAGDRVSILDVNSHRFLEAYYAAAAAGLILNPLNHRLAAPELAAILQDAGSRCLVAGPGFETLVEELRGHGLPLECALLGGDEYEACLAAHAGPFEPAAASPDDVAQLYYTSGTTGVPKGVMLTHRNVVSHARGTIAELGLSADDVWGHIAPMFHLADAWASFAITLVGGVHVMVPRFGAESVLRAIEQERITISNLIPTMLNLMVKHPRAREFDLTSLRAILSGGAPIAPEVVRQIIAVLGCEYVQTYGLTETSPYLTLSLLHEHLAELPAEERLRYQARTGRACSFVELKLADAAGAPVPADDQTVGEIWARGETVTPGYWNRPEETAAAFAPGGWLRTGDLAVIDGEGYFNIVDRRKDMIVSGGENVYSIEVENALYAHPAVLEAAAFGLPDPTWGEAVTAAVVLKAGESCSAEALIAFCREQIAAYKAPKQVHFLDELPRTGSGKISKKTLRESFGPTSVVAPWP